jgi:hypothetical protein
VSDIPYQKPGSLLREATTVVTSRELARLRRRDVILEALEQHGVDNWDWYGEAMRDAHRSLGEEED